MIFLVPDRAAHERTAYMIERLVWQTALKMLLCRDADASPFEGLEKGPLKDYI